MPALFLGFLWLAAAAALLESHQILVIAGDCPLDFSWANFTLAASACSNRSERSKCCRYINALVAVSIAHYSKETGELGVPHAFSDICLSSVSETFKLYGIPPGATLFCGLGPKIRVSYQCVGRETVLEMMQSPNFDNVSKNCKMPLSVEGNCRRCLNSGVEYLHHLIREDDNVTLSICRDAVFVVLANQGDSLSTVDMSSCFFGVEGFSILPEPSSQPRTPTASPAIVTAQSPTTPQLGMPSQRHLHKFQFTLIPGIGIVVIGSAVVLLLIFILLIRKKSKQLLSSATPTETSWNAFPPPQDWKRQGPSSMFQRFSYQETKKATENFRTVIGKGGFGTVYKAQFSNGLIAAVKRMNVVSKQGEEEFCQEIELLSRLHHRHLVALKGFCVEGNERFLVYEYMENGSLKDHLHSTGRNPLMWKTRLQIAVGVANALEYLHFYCDPPLCHRDIKSSNILLDENFVAKVADFGLAHASRSGTVSFEPVNTDVRGTPGYMDPEYLVTQELSEKSDIYSYGVLLLELLTGRRAIQNNRNLVEWSKQFMATDSRLPELVDPAMPDPFDLEQLQMVAAIIQWCTESEGRARPSIKQVLRMFSERLDPVGDDFDLVMEHEEHDDRRPGKVTMHRNQVIFHSGDARCLPSSSSTSRSYCSRSVLLESSSPQSPLGNFSP